MIDSPRSHGEKKTVVSRQSMVARNAYKNASLIQYKLPEG